MSIFAVLMRFEKMKYTGVCILSLLLLLPATAPAQDVVVDYNKPREYIVGGVSVEGCHYFSEQQIKPTEEVKPTTAPTEAADGTGYDDGYSGYDSYNYDGYGDYGVYQDDYSWYADDGGYVDYGVY